MAPIFINTFPNNNNITYWLLYLRIFFLIANIYPILNANIPISLRQRPARLLGHTNIALLSTLTSPSKMEIVYAKKTPEKAILILNLKL